MEVKSEHLDLIRYIDHIALWGVFHLSLDRIHTYCIKKCVPSVVTSMSFPLFWVHHYHFWSFKSSYYQHNNWLWNSWLLLYILWMVLGLLDENRNSLIKLRLHIMEVAEMGLRPRYDCIHYALFVLCLWLPGTAHTDMSLYTSCPTI